MNEYIKTLTKEEAEKEMIIETKEELKDVFVEMLVQELNIDLKKARIFMFENFHLIDNYIENQSGRIRNYMLNKYKANFNDDGTGMETNFNDDRTGMKIKPNEFFKLDESYNIRP